MQTLSASQVLFLHAQLARYLGAPRGVADTAALAAALAQVDTSAPAAGLFDMVAILASALARHRPFAAANHALAAAAAGLLLRHYDLDLRLDPADMPALAALLTSDERDALADWLRARTQPLPLE